MIAAAKVQYLSKHIGCPVIVNVAYKGGHTCGKPVTHEESSDGQYWVSRCDEHCNHTDSWLCDWCNHQTQHHDYSDRGVTSCRVAGCATWHPTMDEQTTVTV